MSPLDKIQPFESQSARTVWDEEKEEWHFLIVDVVAVSTEQITQVAANVLKKILIFKRNPIF